MAANFQPAIGFGGQLLIQTDYPADLPGTFTDVGHVIDFGCNIDVAEVDITHQQSATAAPYYAEYIPGKVSLELTFNCNFDPGDEEHGGDSEGTDAGTILGYLGQLTRFKYVFDDHASAPSTWTFVGFYRTPNINVPNEAQHTADVTIRVTGAPTFVGAVTPP